MTGSLAHPRTAGVAGSADSPACDGRSRGAARRAKHGSAGRRPVDAGPAGPGRAGKGGAGPGRAGKGGAGTGPVSTGPVSTGPVSTGPVTGEPGAGQRGRPPGAGGA